MSVQQRRVEIIRQLHRDGYVEAKKLSGEFGVDTSTIRRDLDVLVRSGQAERTHGGAKAVGGAALDVPYAVKEFERRQQKVAIAAHATARVREGDSVVLDSGSTTFQVAMALRNIPDLTFITNDLRIATLLAAVPDVRLFLAGGELLNSVFTLTGPRATEFLTASSEAMSARWLVAMAKIAPLSLAVETFRPVFTRFCATFRSRFVAFRFCRAMRAPALVLMLLAILAVLCLQTMSGAILAAGSFLLGCSRRKARASRVEARNWAICLFFQECVFGKHSHQPGKICRPPPDPAFFA